MHEIQGNGSATDPSLGQSHLDIVWEATRPAELIKGSMNRVENQVLSTKGHPTVRGQRSEVRNSVVAGREQPVWMKEDLRM